MSVPVLVVCALIEREGRVLIAQRPEGKHLASKWEFPGGKVETGEEPEAALIREIREELGCELVLHSRLPASSHAYERGEITLLPFRCTLAAGSAEPHAHEHAALAWVTLDELGNYDLAEADLPIVESWAAALADEGLQDD
jgi:8-oxo-dGTP diphosphatase